MKITLSPTAQIVSVNGAPHRVWEGHSEKGVPLQALIAQVAVHKDHDNSEFERDLRESNPGRPEAEVFPLRMFLD